MNTKTTGAETAKPRAAKARPAKELDVKIDAVQPEEVNAPVANVDDNREDVKIRVRQITQDMYVTVRNGFNGVLVYKSRKTGERFQWDEFGSEQEMEIQELKNAKNSNKAFFENGWFLIDDPAVIAYLGLERCYQNTLSYTEFDELFSLDPEGIRARLAKVPKGQRLSIAYRAHQMISDGLIDSLKAISALEESLGIKLVER